MGNLILGRDVLIDWEIFPLDIDGVIAGGWPRWVVPPGWPPTHQKEPWAGPTFYRGTLQPNGLAYDTFLKLGDWSKVREVHVCVWNVRVA